MNFTEFHHPEENARLQDLHSLQILDTPLEERFERITRMVQRCFDVPICAISCIDKHRQWFKSIQGINVAETARCVSFCQHTVLQKDTLVVNDARTDERFSDNPLVTADPNIVFYAGTQIYSKDKLPIASLCIIDTKPRTVDDDELKMLSDFARMVESELRLHHPNDIHTEVTKKISSPRGTTLVDPLTRIWSAEGIAMLLEGHLGSRKSCGSGLCLALIDLENFGEINSQLGFPKGDECLITFAKYLLKQVDSEHLVGRVQGNTFCVLMDSIRDQEALMNSLQAFQSFIDYYPILGIKGREMIGGHVAAVQIPIRWQGDIERLFEEAREAMYVTKASDPIDGIRRPTLIDITEQHDQAA